MFRLLFSSESNVLKGRILWQIKNYHIAQVVDRYYYYKFLLFLTADAEANILKSRVTDG